MADKPRAPKSSRYRDIATRLQKEIRLGKYPVGNLLPTETELMAQHSSSRQTVREALRILMDQGLIVRRAGLGSVVIAAEPPSFDERHPEAEAYRPFGRCQACRAARSRRPLVFVMWPVPPGTRG